MINQPYIPPTKPELRKFGLVMTAAFFVLSLIVTGIGYWLHGGIRWNRIYLLNGIGLIGFLAPAVVFPSILAPVHFYWMKFGRALGWVNQRLILGLVWYLVFTPVSIVQMLIGRDPMHRKPDKNAKTYWIDRSKEQRGPKHFERQF